MEEEDGDDAHEEHRRRRNQEEQEQEVREESDDDDDDDDDDGKGEEWVGLDVGGNRVRLFLSVGCRLDTGRAVALSHLHGLHRTL